MIKGYKMDTRFFRLMVLMSLCLSISTVYAEEAAAPAVEADQQQPTENPVVSIEDALEQEITLGRERAVKMRAPRDAFMADIGRINEQIEARKAAILAENETAAELKAEVAELDKQIVEKSEALATIFDTDEELLVLRAQQTEKQTAFRKSQTKLRDEVAQQHRERRHLLEQARQAAAEKAAEAKQAAETAEKE